MIDIYYYGMFFGDGGYQKAATTNVLALEKYINENNCKARVIPKNPKNIKRYKNIDIENMSERKSDKEADKYLIIHKQPIVGEEKEPVLSALLEEVGDMKKVYYYTVFETDRIPKHFVRVLDKYFNIIVPSSYCKYAFQKDLPKKDITIIPHVIDSFTDKAEDILPENDFKLERKTNNVVFVSSCSQVSDRKGMDILLKAYLAEFSERDNVELLLHVAPLRGEKDIERVENFITGIKGAFYWKKNTSNIMLISDILSDGQMQTLYKYGDYFISTTRGEGFGLQIAEAVLCKCPVIYPNYGGFVDYMKDVGMKLDVKEDRVVSTTYPYDITFAKWGEPTIDSTMKTMRRAYNIKTNGDYEKEEEAVKKHRKELLKSYSYSSIGGKLWKIIDM